MIDIELAPTPNQSLSIQLDGAFYDLTVLETRGVMAVTIARDGVTLVSGMRAVAGTPLLPYRYLEAGAGNFLFTTEDEAYPYFDQFGVTQFLVYVSAAELVELRA